MNVVAIEPRTHNVLIKKVYDTSSSAKESLQLGRDLKHLATGTILMVAVKEDAVGKLSKNVLEYFAGQGASDIQNLA
jgi:hypothetical protein